jgi:hypothetical protein
LDREVRQSVVEAVQGGGPRRQAEEPVDQLRRRRLRVPEEVSVMGAGGEEIPALTCHQVDWYLMGGTAVQVLLRSLADPERLRVEHHLSSHTLRVGQTTAAPGSTAPGSITSSAAGNLRKQKASCDTPGSSAR